MISTDNISKQFGSDFLFENINITFNQGERYCLIGANGSGKSTFMKILSGELESSSGKVKIDIFKKYKLEDVQQAHTDLESRKIIGPAVIIP